MEKNLISIVIANFNGENYLDICLKSVLKSDYNNFEVIIIDDASTDQSLAILNKFQIINSKITLLKNSKNIGPAACRNKAFRRAKGSIIVFLDNDTEVTAGWLSEFNELLKDESIGAAQALLLDFEKRDQIQVAGGQLIPYTVWLKPFLQKKNYNKIRNKLTDNNIVGVSAALAVKKNCFGIVKGFDEKEEKFTEDLDFCWRIWIAGFRVVLSCKSIVYHHTKSISQRENAKTNKFEIYYHMSKNSIRSMIKNYELRNLPLNLLLFLLLSVMWGLWTLITRMDYTALMGTFFGIGWNILNLNNALDERAGIEKNRIYSDKYLFSNVFDQRYKLVW